jgi:hypothetical protein
VFHTIRSRLAFGWIRLAGLGSYFQILELYISECYSIGPVLEREMSVKRNPEFRILAQGTGRYQMFPQIGFQIDLDGKDVVEPKG